MKKYKMRIIMIIYFILMFTYFAVNSDAKPVNSEIMRARINVALKIVDARVGGEKLYSESMVELLLLTLAVETDFDSVRGDKNSYDKGPYQLNKNNVKDLYKNFLSHNSKFRQKANFYKQNGSLENFEYSTVLAALHYKRMLKGYFPDKNNIWELVFCWKIVYNTHIGKGTTYQAYEKYKSYVRDLRIKKEE